MPPPDQEQQLAHYFNLFGLMPAADKLIENYSHGMRQKLVIGASMMHNPEVIIVDEPMVGLDPQSTRIVKNLFRDKARAGCTVFLSTHVLQVAEELADRIGIIHRGRLLFLVTIAELRGRQSIGDVGLEELFLALTDTRRGRDHGLRNGGRSAA